MFIETPRLILRALRESDLDDLYQYQSDPETVRYIPWTVRTREEVSEALMKYRAIPDFSKDGDSVLLGWELKVTGKVIGQCSFTLESLQNQHGEIGYVSNPKYSGNGYASEAIRALISDVFSNFPVRRLSATIDPRNKKSLALVTRLGFRHEGTFLENEYIKGEWVDTAFYAIRKSEFENMNY